MPSEFQIIAEQYFTNRVFKFICLTVGTGCPKVKCIFESVPVAKLLNILTESDLFKKPRLYILIFKPYLRKKDKGNG